MSAVSKYELILKIITRASIQNISHGIVNGHMWTFGYFYKNRDYFFHTLRQFMTLKLNLALRNDQ